jgi:hypothetical protein
LTDAIARLATHPERLEQPFLHVQATADLLLKKF